MDLKSIFVSYRPFVEGKGGGVQVCTREYIEVLRRAGFDLEFQLFDGDRRLSTRVRRRLFASPYFRPVERCVVPNILAAAAQIQASHIFLNQTTLASLAPELKSALPNCRIVLLSHGLESTDLLHTIRLRHQMPITAKTSPSARVLMGDTLLQEARFRPSVDAVCTISPFDAELEKWLGTREAFWLPRTIQAAPLNWKPRQGRFGFVGTLDHAPNLDGLLRVLEVFSGCSAGENRIRIVGGPKSLGGWLAKKFSIVEYLGPLSDKELEAEASSWNAFLHPIFFLARGCSTKLASALAWQIPIVTTELGCRGYVWRRGRMVIGNSPMEFVRRCFEMVDERRATEAREDVADIVRTTPTVQENAVTFLERLAFCGNGPNLVNTHKHQFIKTWPA